MGRPSSAAAGGQGVCVTQTHGRSRDRLSSGVAPASGTDEPFAAERVLAAAHQLASDPLRALLEPLPLPARYEQTALTLLKAPF